MSANGLVSLKLPRSVYFHDLSNFSEDRTGGNDRHVFLSRFSLALRGCFSCWNFNTNKHHWFISVCKALETWFEGALARVNLRTKEDKPEDIVFKIKISSKEWRQVFQYQATRCSTQTNRLYQENYWAMIRCRTKIHIGLHMIYCTGISNHDFVYF